jgi:apolipoprotein N-acyltransferase
MAIMRRVGRLRPRPGRHWIPPIASACFGLLLTAAFPPIGFWWLAPLCVAGFTLAAQSAAAGRGERGLRRPAAAAGWCGLWFGLAFCISLFQWLTSVGTDAWIGLGIIEALYFIPLGIGTAAVARLRGAALWQALLWIAVEAARDRFPFGGMSWGRLAFSQTHTVFTPLAALGGAPLVSFATALAGTVLAALAYRGWQARRDPAARTWRVVRPAAAWTALALAIPAVGWLVPIQTTAGTPVQLAAIQGDVPRTGLDAYGQESAVLDNHVAVTDQYAAEIAAGKLPQPAAVFWPEDSDDVDPFTDPIAYQQLTAAAQAVKVPILVGTVVAVGATQARNEGIVWSPTTGPGETYVKRHLVPLGEYIPYRSILTKYFSELSLVPRDYVPGTKPGVLTVGTVKIADVICFEVAFDDIVRDSVRGGGGVIVVQTNNATYGRTGQPEQQLAISQLRAVESGRPVMVAATSGISAYINADGDIEQQTAQFTPAIVAAEVTPRTGLTLADRVGALPEIAMTFAALAAWAFALALALRAGRRTAVTGSAEPSGTVTGEITRSTPPRTPASRRPTGLPDPPDDLAAAPADVYTAPPTEEPTMRKART